VDALVCVKAIVHEPPRLRDEGGVPVFERARSAPVALNESDAYAIDEAVLLKKRHGGRVTAVTAGPLASQDALYAALAKGADEAFRVDAEPSDPLLVAELLAAVVAQGSYDLVLTGIESRDGLASAVGPALAARLDLPFASAVTAIELAEGEGRARVTREQGGGFFQTLDMPLPAVLCVQSGICRLSYPPTIRVLQARKRPPRGLSPKALGIELGAASARLVAVAPPRREREAEIVSGDPGEIARALLDRIERALAGT
jgi:electron transfer flavoprotein beta subunit